MGAVLANTVAGDVGVGDDEGGEDVADDHHSNRR